MNTSSAILRFLGTIGHRSEAEFYLALFRAERKESFAMLVLDAVVAHHAVEALVRDLSFLHALGLVPVVCVGLYHPGVRVADSAERLRTYLERADVPTSLVSAATSKLTEVIGATARSGAIPIVRFDPDGVDISGRFSQLGALVEGLQCRKVLFVSRRGGLRPKGADADLSVVNLATDFDHIAAERSLSPRQFFLLAAARRLLLEQSHHRLLVAFTSPLELLPELFTTRGSGTLVKRGGRILRFDDYTTVDTTRLRALLESSFGRVLREEFFDQPTARIYLEEHYRAAAIIRQTPLGSYLCKFAVEREAQGEGMGRDIWDLVLADYPVLFWRARASNPIRNWYVDQCDGLNRCGTWDVYWKRVATESIARVIDFALAQPVDFSRPP